VREGVGEAIAQDYGITLNGRLLVSIPVGVWTVT
jgi:hypothetical protein